MAEDVETEDLVGVDVLRGRLGAVSLDETEEIFEQFLEKGEDRRVWRINEAGRKLTIRVRYRVAEGEKLRVDYKVVVAAPDVEVEIKAVGAVEGEKELNMTIEFLRGARGSLGVVKDEVILIGKKAQNVSRPIILSAEKEAIGKHGVSVGRIDGRAAEYMRTRGISGKKAREMLIEAKLKGV